MESVLFCKKSVCAYRELEFLHASVVAAKFKAREQSAWSQAKNHSGFFAYDYDWGYSIGR